ncbi:MAG: alpha-glucosidase/alpha-galactosidase [Defluviitaleaceae bacterium]|nr:alpha-glucosidase/alpha-galactosidase [Defluviitaleaceae bacterium]
MSFKIAFIGAGSIGFTRGLFTDLMSVPAFRDIEVSFTDINKHNLDMVTQLCQRDLDENGVKIKIHATTDRREAFRGAKYIFNCVRIGMLEAFTTDIEIPLKYGVDQCVGDTLCAGGIMYGQRGVEAMRGFCEDIREVAEPGAIMLNYANPNAMMTWAANNYFGVPTIGLCHGVMGGQWLIAHALGLEYGDIDVICAGINHQTWYISVKHNGVDMLDKILPALETGDEYVAKKERVRIDVLKRFGYFSTESNGHLSEYLAWYRKRPEEIIDWIDLGVWINGETGGYLRVCTESRNWFETDFPNWLKEPPKKYDGSDRGREHGSYILEGLETGKCYRGHFNVVNNGCITNLPDDCIVEVPCYADANGINVPKIGDLPLGCAAICSQSVWVQRIAVEAAVRGDDKLLKQAMLLDPLTGAVLNPPEVWQLTDEMLIAQEKWLPQYAEAIKAAKARRDRGEWFETKANEGAARLKTKTVGEMSDEKEKMRRIAAASEKENEE